MGCEWYHPRAGGPGFCKKAGWVCYEEQASKQHPPWPLHELLPPGSSPIWVPDLTSFNAEEYCGSVSQINSFLPNLHLGHAVSSHNRNSKTDGVQPASRKQNSGCPKSHTHIVRSGCLGAGDRLERFPEMTKSRLVPSWGLIKAKCLLKDRPVFELLSPRLSGDCAPKKSNQKPPKAWVTSSQQPLGTQAFDWGHQGPTVLGILGGGGIGLGSVRNGISLLTI